jgi:hypothetical protein
MKKFIANLLGILITFFGMACCSIYITSKISIGSAIFGLMGFLIVNPAFTAWQKYFTELFGFNDKDVDAK